MGNILDYVFGALNTDLSVEFKNCIPIVGNFNISRYQSWSMECIGNEKTNILCAFC